METLIDLWNKIPPAAWGVIVPIVLGMFTHAIPNDKLRSGAKKFTKSTIAKIKPVIAKSPLAPAGEFILGTFPSIAEGILEGLAEEGIQENPVVKENLTTAELPTDRAELEAKIRSAVERGRRD